jgi:pyrimidine-nucleoside phosphorylase
VNPSWTIQKKRDGGALSSDEIAAFVEGFTRGEVPDYQMAALAMSVYFRGMDERETADLARALADSGETLDWRGVATPRADKHSTGGLGDKVSLVLAPALACCGVCVPMVAGRGLGPTGGTIDKLESIPGLRTALSPSELRRQCESVGCAISAQGEALVPADRKLYALRDVTATVASVPLITASILSKKLAERLDALVLDVKWGSGAFMKTLPEARELARALVATGGRLGVKSRALVTDMNQPLGRAVGNALEVAEAFEALRGGGPADLRSLVLALGAEVLVLAGAARVAEEAWRRLEHAIDSGRALERFRAMVRAQGGDPDAPLAIAPGSPVAAPRRGRVAAIDGERLGYAVIALGGGRRRLGDPIDRSVGLRMRVRLGDGIEAGEPLADLHCAGTGEAEARRLIVEAVSIAEAEAECAPPPLVVERI